MQIQNVYDRYRSFYLLGIGGVGMSALAVYLKSHGYLVFGYDKNLNKDIIRRLRAFGIIVSDCENYIPQVDAVIYSGALIGSKIYQITRERYPMFSRAEVLGHIMSTFPTSVGICGCHGKTTATAMLGEILKDTSATVFLGGEYTGFQSCGGFGNVYMNGESVCLAEACEFQRSFLRLRPTIAVALNVDADHMDCYADMEELSDCYRRFLESAAISVTNVDDPILATYPSGVTFGFCEGADYTAKEIREKKGCFRFDCYERGKFAISVSLSVPGKHQIYNALAAIAAARQLFVPFSVIQNKLQRFCGVERRMEILGRINDVPIYADYAHHPKEITATNEVMHSFVGKNYLMIFQPHTYSRTTYLFKDFCIALGKIPALVVYRTYGAREDSSFDADEKKLSTALGVPYVKDSKELEEVLMRSGKEYDAVVLVGAGDIYEEGKDIIKKIKEPR